MNTFFEEYQVQVDERAVQGIPPLPLSLEQTEKLVKLLENPVPGKEKFLEDLIINRVTPGVDPSAQIKTEFLMKIVLNEKSSPIITIDKAIKILGTMIGGYNLSSLITLLENKNHEIAKKALNELKPMVLAINEFQRITTLSETGNVYAKELINSYANAEWFTSKKELPEFVRCVVYKVNGEINTDDFSPASHAFTRSDIPLHANAMGGSLFPSGPKAIAELKLKEKLPVAFVGDVVGTGSSRKSAINSLLWHIGEDIPYVPNKRRNGFILGGIIAPIFFNTAQDSGALPIECDVTNLISGQIITINLKKSQIFDEKGLVITKLNLKPDTILDEYKAGGRVPLIIGKELTKKARSYLKLNDINEMNLFSIIQNPKPNKNQGYTLAQKMVGLSCGLKGVLPGSSLLPKMTTVGSQDTTGPMTANEITELACLKFTAPMVMQSFCHTAAYPKPSDVITHATLPQYISNRGGVSLRPGDGIIHSWLNRLLVPDTVGTGGDSHTRFPLGISFPAGSGLVAFAAALGVMPLDMPESVLVKFTGKLQPGITLRDIVNSIPLKAIEMGLLTVEKKNKKNIFSGKILEMEGLPDLKVEQAFELTDASAERSSAASTIKLSKSSVNEYLNSNIRLMEEMINKGFQDKKTLEKRIKDVKDWLNFGQLMEADKNAEYAATIEINLNEITEPIVACPNDPDDVKKLSAVSGEKIDDVFVGSCMTNIGHFRALSSVLENNGKANTNLWVCPPTKMDEDQLRKEGYLTKFKEAGARLETPGCSLCMGNQARVEDGVTVFSTSTRNFNNRMGKDAQVYLGSSELAAVVALTGSLPTPEKYLEIVGSKLSDEKIYTYLNFNKMKNFKL